MTEMLIVLGVTVVLAGAAVPGGLKVLQGMRQMHLNRAAETIYMTVQRNLAAAKASGEAVPGDHTGAVGSATAPADSGHMDSVTTGTVLPAGTLSPTLYYDGHWIVYYSGWLVSGVRYSETEKIETWDDAAWDNWQEEINTGTFGKVGKYGT